MKQTNILKNRGLYYESSCSAYFFLARRAERMRAAESLQA
jgi:hypothetical protein